MTLSLVHGNRRARTESPGLPRLRRSARDSRLPTRPALWLDLSLDNRLGDGRNGRRFHHRSGDGCASPALIRLENRGGDTTAVRHVVTVGIRPLTDRRGLLTRATGPRRRLLSGHHRTGTRTASAADERSESIPQGSGVPLTQVDLVKPSVDVEGNRLGGFATV